MQPSPEWALTAHILDRVSQAAVGRNWRRPPDVASRRGHLLTLWRELSRLGPEVPERRVCSVDEVLDIYEALLGRRAGAERAGQALRDVLAALVMSGECIVRMLRNHGHELTPAESQRCMQVLPLAEYADFVAAHVGAAPVFDWIARDGLKTASAGLLCRIVGSLDPVDDAQRLIQAPRLLLNGFPMAEAAAEVGSVRARLGAALNAPRLEPDRIAQLTEAAQLCDAIAAGAPSQELLDGLWHQRQGLNLYAFKQTSSEYEHQLWVSIHRFERFVPNWFVASYFGSTKPWRIEIGPITDLPGADSETLRVEIDGARLHILFGCSDGIAGRTRLKYIFPLLDRVADRCAGDTKPLVFHLGLGDDCTAADAVTFCSNIATQILVPDSCFLERFGYRDQIERFERLRLPFSQRLDKAYWRGTDTGVYRYADPRSSPRVRACMLSNERPEAIDAKIVNIEHRPGWEAKQAIYHELGLNAGHEPIDRILAYRYNIDIDGNTNAWNGLFLKLLSGSVVLKVGSEFGFRQWYYGRLEPWVHFVPVSPDLSDLLQHIEFLQSQPGLAEAIGRNGRELALSMDAGGEIEAAAHRIITRVRLRTR